MKYSPGRLVCRSRYVERDLRTHAVPLIHFLLCSRTFAIFYLKMKQLLRIQLCVLIGITIRILLLRC